MGFQFQPENIEIYQTYINLHRTENWFGVIPVNFLINLAAVHRLMKQHQWKSDKLA